MNQIIKLGINEYCIEKEKRILNSMIRHNVSRRTIVRQRNLIGVLELNAKL